MEIEREVEYLNYAWESGYEAYGRFMQSECPFHPGTKAYRNWIEGWECAEVDNKNRSGAED